MNSKVSKRILAFVLALTVIIANLYIPAVEVQAAAEGKWSDHTEQPTAGAGTEADPYQVTKPEHLAWIAANGQKSTNIGCFKLMNDIDLAAHLWVPGKYFLGTLDGNGKTVKNMTIDNTTVISVDGSDYAGLIAVLRPDAVIKNLTLDKVNISIERDAEGVLNVGAVAGQSTNGTVDHCFVKGSITVDRSTTASAAVTRVAGIVGYGLAWGAKVVNVTNSINESTITAEVDAGILTAGGVFGHVGHGGTDSGNVRKVNLINSANMGNVSVAGAASSGYAGGLVGWLQTVTVIKSGYSTGAIANTCTGTAGKGAIAGMNNSTNLTVENLYYLNDSAESDGVGDKAVAKTDAEMKDAEFAATMMQAALDAQAAYGWEAANGCYPSIGDNAPVVGPETWLNHAASAFASGTGTKADPYIITSAAELALVAKKYATEATSAGVYFEIQKGSTIDLAGYEWMPITEFCGHFNGNGVQIKNMEIKTPCDISAVASGSHAAGMFGIIHKGATVKNVTVDVAITVESGLHLFVGGVVGQCRDAVVDNCKVSGTIDAKMVNGSWNNFLVGGVVGRLYSAASTASSVLNCISSVSITTNREDANGNRCVGGIVGEAYATADSTVNIEIVNCANIGTITATGTKGTRYDVGGLIGYMWKKSSNTTTKLSMQNCYNAGTVDASAVENAAVGSIAGTIYAATYLESAYLYYLEGSASGAGANVSGISANSGHMQHTDFVDKLNANAREVAGGVAYGWVHNQNGYPTHSDDYIDAYVSWAVRGESLGGVTVEIQESGSDVWTPITKPGNIPVGCQIRFTFTPGSNGKIKVVTVNGAEVTLTNNVYQIAGNGSITMAVTYLPLVEEAPVNVYVDPDAAAGGNGTEASPLKTLEQAKEEITRILAERPYANIVVHLMGGTYTLDETLKLGAEQSSDGRVTFKNYKDEKPVISGAQQIPTGGFTKVEGQDYYSYQLKETDKIDGKWPEFRTLLINGKSATLARTKDLIFTKSYPNEIMSGYGIKSCDNGIFLNKEAMAGITDANSKTLEVLMYIEWKVQIYHLENIKDNGMDVSATIRASEWEEWYANDRTKRTLSGKTYFLQNHLNFLDEAGEFFYDEETGTIYYIPFEGEDLSTATVEYATLDVLVELENACNITFDGIGFTGTTANTFKNGYIGQLGAMVLAYAGDVDGVNVPVAAIRGDYATGIQIKNCRFEELGGHGILMENGIEDLEISGNVIRNVGISGILVGVNGQDITLPGASRNVNITNNYVTNVGVVIPSGMGISVARCVNLKILHNKVVYVPYTGIRVGWGFNIQATENGNINLVNAEIAYNHVENFMMKINDGGAIYTAGANGFKDKTDLFNSVHDNFIKGNGNRGTCNGIYHDGSSSNWHTYNNVVVDVKLSLHPQDDVPSQHTHNLLVENNFTTHCAMSTSATADRNVVLKNNTHVADMDALPEAAKDIIKKAGLEDAFKSNESPIDVQVDITNPTIHQSIPDENAAVTLELKITNNSNETKTLTVSMMADLLANVKVEYVGNGITLAPGESGIVTAILSVEDPESMEITAVTAQGFVVTDQHGRITGYPRAFSLAITKSGTINEVVYGTPVIDGIMDDIYKDSHRIPLGVVFHPNALASSDVTGYTYLVWDENYLYCYVVVHDNSVVSRGLDFINKKDVNQIWASDTVETYLRTTLRKQDTPQNTKFAVDAYGVMRYSNAESHKNTFEYHNSLPFATAFTYNGEVIQNYSIKEPAKDQNASTAEHPVNGYVVEMTLPIKEIASLQVAGQPQAGDQFTFKIQVDDFDGTYQSAGDAYVVALQTENISMTLVKNAVITQDAVDTEKQEGQNATFTVAASGVDPIAYQWQTLGADGKWTDIEGATEATYTINGVTMAMDGSKYRCVITDAVSKVTSAEATLTVTRAPDQSPGSGDSSMIAGAMLLAVVSLMGLAAMLGSKKYRAF